MGELTTDQLKRSQIDSEVEEVRAMHRRSFDLAKQLQGELNRLRQLTRELDALRLRKQCDRDGVDYITGEPLARRKNAEMENQNGDDETGKIDGEQCACEVAKHAGVQGEQRGEECSSDHSARG